jgi:Janus kinase 1
MLSIPPHRNIVRIFGLCQELNNFSLVMEFLPEGALDSYLARGSEIPAKEMYRIVRGIARGMEHLAAQNIVHRDLAARNILLDANHEPRVSGTSIKL